MFRCCNNIDSPNQIRETELHCLKVLQLHFIAVLSVERSNATCFIYLLFLCFTVHTVQVVVELMISTCPDSSDGRALDM